MFNKIRVFLCVGFISMLAQNVNATGIPTVDIVGNIRGALQLVEETISTIEIKIQSVQQITQIRNEIEMIANQAFEAQRQIENMANLDVFRFKDIEDSLRKLKDAGRRAGSLAYAATELKKSYEKYKDEDFYKNNFDTFSKKIMIDAKTRWNNNKLNTAKSSAAVLDIQGTFIDDDAKDLAILNRDVKGVSGEVQAVQAGNQIASFTANQLLQLRTLIMNSQQMEIQEKASEAEKEIMYEMTTKKSTEFNFDPKKSSEF